MQDVQQQQQVRPAHGQLALPASSLTAASLRGCLSSAAQMPPLRAEDGELRLCGLTFHPHVAPDTRAAVDTWHAALPWPLADADPVTQQVYVGALGEEVPEAHRVWAQQHPLVRAALEEGRAVVERHGLNARDLAWEVVLMLGWLNEWGVAWPQGGVELQGVEACVDVGRGGRGLRATGPAPMTNGSVIGAMGGYVMPDDVACAFAARGFQVCGPDAAAELARRAGRVANPAWRVLSWSYMSDYCGGE